MYNIGQFRRTQQNNYLDILNITINYQIVSNTSFNNDLQFLDVCGQLQNNNIMNNKNCYYLRFGVQQRTDSVQNFYLKIKNSNEIEDNEQYIDEYSVGRGNQIVYFEVILSPNSTYNKIIWELQRTNLDYKINNFEEQSGRLMNITIDKFGKLIDIIPILQTKYNELTSLSKIGIQGPPSLLMCINKEPIRIGKSGIYELNNGIKITSISFVPKESQITTDGLDYFIMDFQY